MKIWKLKSDFELCTSEGQIIDGQEGEFIIERGKTFTINGEKVVLNSRIFEQNPDRFEQENSYIIEEMNINESEKEIEFKLNTLDGIDQTILREQFEEFLNRL